jgi:protein-glutamine gamma-glutamyltransferase
MKLPPMLLGAALLFWGWETGLPTVGGVLAVLIEGLRLLKPRWNPTEDDFNRLWNFCTLIFIATAVYAFTANQGPAAVSRFVDEPSFGSQRMAGEASQRTAASLLQWLPVVFFPFLLGLVGGRRDTVKLTVFSLIARSHKRRREPGPLADKEVHAAWVYFGICLVAACINTNDGPLFFGGLSGLLVWALWTRRSRRFALPVFLLTAVAACAVGYLGQQQLGDLRRFMESYSPQWPWRWSGHRTSPNEANTSIGQIGRLKTSGRIVIRLEPRDGGMPPALLRTASYRFFRSPNNWLAANNHEELNDPPRFSPIFSETGSNTWVLRDVVTPLRVHIETYLDGEGDLLPLPLTVARLEDFPPYAAIKTNNLGAVMAQGPDVVLFDAFSSAVGSIDSPPSPPADFGDDLSPDYSIPPRELPAIKAVVSQMHLDGLTTNEKLRAISSYFQDRFEYSLWQEPRSLSEGTNGTPLANFLLQTHKGHCEYFATATVLILRELGIPARYAVGWSVQEASGKGFVVRERHAHAWCLAYYNGHWHDFDTTPGSWVNIENNRASPLQFLSDAWGRLKFEFLKWRSGQSNLRDYIWWIVGPMLLFLLYRLVRRKPGQRAGMKVAAEADALARLGLDSEFYLVEKKLAQLGFVRPPGETLGQFLERALRDARMAGLSEALIALLRVHYRLRFDPLGLIPEEREALRVRVRETLERLGQPKSET